MKRWNELLYNLGFKILFPRLCLYGILPCMILLGPDNMAWLVYWSRTFNWTVIILFGSLFMFNVAANLAISHYLRLHQTDASPYKYEIQTEILGYTPYFRIHVKDSTSFRRHIKSLRAEHRGEAIRLWLWLDEFILVPAFLIAFLMFIVSLPLVVSAWLIRRFKARHQPSLT